MNLSSMLRERAAAGRPVRIGQVGAGKFGTMFLSQVRLTHGHAPGGPRRPDAGAGQGAAWSASAGPRSRPRRSRLGDALKTGKTFVTDDAMAVIAHPEIEVVIEATGDPGTGIKLCQAAIAHGKHIVMVNVEADALAGPAAGAAGAGGGRRLLAGLGRPAGADLRARRLGAHLRVQGGRRRQGHALPPDLSPLQPRHGVGHPRPVPEDQGPQPHQPEDVQLVHRRHQVGHRDDGGVQRHGPGAADQRAWASRRPRASSWPTCASPGAKAARWRRRA